jgi:hypothetical protein
LSDQQRVDLAAELELKIGAMEHRENERDTKSEDLEPTIGLEPMTCRLRIDCSTN